MLFPDKADKQLSANLWQEELEVFQLLFRRLELHTAQELANLTHQCWRNKQPGLDLPESFQPAGKCSQSPSWAHPQRKFFLISSPFSAKRKVGWFLITSSRTVAPLTAACYRKAQENQRLQDPACVGQKNPSRIIWVGIWGYKSPTKGRWGSPAMENLPEGPQGWDASRYNFCLPCPNGLLQSWAIISVISKAQHW